MSDVASFITDKVTGKQCSCGHWLKSQHAGDGCMFCECRKRGSK